MCFSTINQRDLNRTNAIKRFPSASRHYGNLSCRLLLEADLQAIVIKVQPETGQVSRLERDVCDRICELLHLVS
jgi:hypothetical protein